MRTHLLALALLLPAAVLGTLAPTASAACTLNPGSTLTVSHPAVATVKVGTGNGSSGFCAAADYQAGGIIACPYTPLAVTVGGFVISVPPVTIIVDPILGVSQDSFVCDKRVEVLP